MSIVLEVLLILVLLVLNGVFAMSELAVMTARKTRLERRAEEEGDRGARAALGLAANPTNFLSTVQVGITLVGVLAGAFGGARLSRPLAERFAEIPTLARYAEPAALGLVVALITFFSLIIGELVPKRIALSNPEGIARRVARPMGLVARIGAPLVALLTGTTNLVFRVLGLQPSTEPEVTEQDIRAMVEQGAESGAVQPAEHEIVENTFRLGDRAVGGIMTPRPDVRWLDASRPAEEIRAQLAGMLAEARGSRLLVCDGNVERVYGVAHAEDLLARLLAGKTLDREGLQAVLRKPLFVPAAMSAFSLLQTFRQTQYALAVAVDEFGGVQGVVTVEDLVEALIGELPEHGEEESARVARQPDGSWLVDGALPMEELETVLELDGGVDHCGYHTVSGLVLTSIGRVPRSGDSFEFQGHRVEVVSVEGRRAASVRIVPSRAPGASRRAQTTRTTESAATGGAA